MQDTWNILKKELSFYGLELIDKDHVKYYSNNKPQIMTISEVYSVLGKKGKENIKLLKIMWKELHEDVLTDKNEYEEYVDPQLYKLFIFSLKDLSLWLKMFDPISVEPHTSLLESVMQKDIVNLSNEQINKFIDYKISIDWIHRLVNKLIYIRRLIKFVSKGKFTVNQYNIKEARGIGGPWSNLDLPKGERVWEWWEEDENFRNRGREIRKQRRYTKGLENYNNGGPVGEGHYWREIRNEPYSWSDKDTESPYPGRNSLWWG